MEKIEKQKQKQKQNKNDQIDIPRLKQSFFFSQTACSPLSFPQIWNPVPTNSEMFKSAYCFTRIRVDSVERLQKQAGSLSGFTGFVWTKG